MHPSDPLSPLHTGAGDTLTQTSDGTISYIPSSTQSALVINTQTLAGGTFAAITFDMEIDATATVLLFDSLTGKSYTLELPPAVQRITLEAASLTTMPVARRRQLEDEDNRYLTVTVTVTDGPPDTPLVLSGIKLATDAPTTAPTSVRPSSPGLPPKSDGFHRLPPRTVFQSFKNTHGVVFSSLKDSDGLAPGTSCYFRTVRRQYIANTQPSPINTQIFQPGGLPTFTLFLDSPYISQIVF